MDFVFDAALDQWYDWDTTPVQWLLLNGNYTPDRSGQVWVSDVVAWEVAVSNYARQAGTGQTRTVDTALHRIVYDCADPTFGGLDTSAPGISALCLAKTGADDASSLLLAIYGVSVGTGPFKALISPNGAYWISLAEGA